MIPRTTEPLRLAIYAFVKSRSEVTKNTCANSKLNPSCHQLYSQTNVPIVS